MRELSLNILDIAQNSISAQAKNITILVRASGGELTITIEDDGKGMSEEFLSKVMDPFTTTRTTRKVGMGLPLFKEAAESSGGSMKITSKLGVGTVVTASFQIDHIDRMPLGDLAGTMTILIMAKPEIDFVLEYAVEDRSYKFDTKEIKSILDGVPIESSEIITYLEGLINDNITQVNGGAVI